MSGWGIRSTQQAVHILYNTHAERCSDIDIDSTSYTDVESDVDPPNKVGGYLLCV